jgi:hypothetical protein
MNPYFIAVVASPWDDLPDSLHTKLCTLACTSRRLDVLHRHELSIDGPVDLTVCRLDSSLVVASSSSAWTPY